MLGAGAMGSLFGGLLAECGHDVTLVDVNAAHVDAIARDGLRLDTDRGERRVARLAALRCARTASPRTRACRPTW